MLRLLGSDLDGPDIARELSVSLNTMRTHTKNIYAKLGVTSRRAAVRQAHELDLLPGPAPRLTPTRPRRFTSHSPHVVMTAHHIDGHLRSRPTEHRTRPGGPAVRARRRRRRA